VHSKDELDRRRQKPPFKNDRNLKIWNFIVSVSRMADNDKSRAKIWGCSGNTVEEVDWKIVHELPKSMGVLASMCPDV
jgi:hypothetical protein